MFASFARSFSSFYLRPTPPPPPQRLSFDDHGTVGLGIVAAMVTGGDVSSRSEPILVLPSANFMMKQDGDNGDHEQQKEEEEGDEMMETDATSESYTCVTSYMGGQAVSKTVYFGLDAAAPITTTTANHHHHRNPVSNSGSKAVFYLSNSPQSAPEYAFPKDFLSICYLCNKSLDGVGVFMYKDNKAFCSPECRYQYIFNDGHEHLDSCGSEVLMNLSDCSQSPSSPPLFSAGIVSA